MSKIRRKASQRSRTPGKILVLHGPNLNMLGIREPAIYGREDLGSINRRLVASARKGGVVLEAFQSNQEGTCVMRLPIISACSAARSIRRRPLASPGGSPAGGSGEPEERRLAWPRVPAKVTAATACIAAESRIQV